MSLSCGFPYAHARAQARTARLLTEPEWMHLAAARTLATYLEGARNTGLRPWLTGFSPSTDSHDIERGVRALLRTVIAEAAGWVPGRWKPAVRWTAWLAELPLLQRVVGAQPLPAWARSDPLFARPAGSALSPAEQAVAASGGKELLRALAENRAADEAWRRAWESLWPDCSDAARRGLQQVAALAHGHWRTGARLTPEQTWPARRDFQARMRHLFHCHPLQPASLFVYLCLAACELERLRGELVGRALFAGEDTP